MEFFILLIHAICTEKCLDIIEQDGLLPFLGQAICWSQCRQDIVKGFGRLSRTVPHEAIISAVHTIGHFLSLESPNYGIPVSKAYEMLKTIGAVAIAKGSELPAIVGMIRSYKDMCQRQALDKVPSVHSREKLSDIITSLIWGGCVDEVVMKELAELHTTCPDFVVSCSALILCF